MSKINQSITYAESPMPHEPHGILTGKLVDRDGAPIPATRIELFAKNIRSETPLGAATTDDQGHYSITYHRPSALNLLVRAHDASGKVIAQSATIFAAPAKIETDLTTAADGVVRTPSTFTNIDKSVAANLQNTPLSELKENKDTHELQFLASATGVPFKHVAYRFIANALGAKNKINDATFFGIFSQNVPPSLSAALASLPDAGIDDAFMAQALNGVLAHSRGTLTQALTAAVNANTLPASYAAVQESELNLLDTLRMEYAGNSPYIRGKTSLNDLLAAGDVTDAVKTAFIQAYAAQSGHLESTWGKLRADKRLPDEDLATLETTLSAGELLAGNLPLVKDTLARLSQKTLASVQYLALLDESDWVARITAVDPEATSIPQVLPNDTPQQRITRFAMALASRFSAKYPTTAFAGGLSKAQISSFAKTKDELVAFLTVNPTFTFHQTNIDHFVATNKVTVSAPALADLKAAQRLSKLSPYYDTVEALRSFGHNSAQSIYFMGREPFLAQMTTALGSASAAKMVYARAQMTYATVLTAVGNYNLALNGTNVAALASAAPEPALLTNLPDLQALFGSLDYFECGDCQSVLSPAAYLVDLLQYLGLFTASVPPPPAPIPPPLSNARQALLLRRPEIQYTALSCNNTNITIPYIDLVNEILESAIAPPATALTLIDTTGTSEERRAIPQNLSQAAYAHTASAVFPLSLPFDLAFARTTAYINALGATRAAILTLFNGIKPSGLGPADAIAGASLGISPKMQAVINGTDTHTAWDRWGLAQAPQQVIDPKTRVAYSPVPADWIAALSKVPVLLNRAGISIQQLYQLLEVVWVTQSGVNLQAGTMTPVTSGGLPILSADTDLMIFTGLTGDVLDRANSFLRLWTASGLQMWEIDWAIGGFGGSLSGLFLFYLTGAMAVQNQLKLPFQEVLGFWQPLETRDITSHLGDEDTVVPSTYSEVFRNPAVLLAWSNVFVPVNQSTITGTSTGPSITAAFPHGYQTGMQVSIAGTLGTTAVNGNFTITVTGINTFVLDGFTGAGAWTSGGIAKGLLSGNEIISPGSATPTPEQNAIAASLGLSADDISAILAFSGAANKLSLPTLGQLLSYQRLASSLSLDISDLILWIELTSGKPFGWETSDTLEFLRRLAVLQGTGLDAEDLDYLLRGGSANQSSLTFTSAQATAVLQTIRDGVAKLPGTVSIPIAGSSNTSPIVINTALPNSLQTGAQVSIGGVFGNTAANGTFTITVTSSTSFTLNGSVGSGDWTGGGSVTFTSYDATAIFTLFVTALATATGTTANVVTPVLLKTGVLPLDLNTIALLVAQSSGVDATQFPALIGAFTLVAKAAALFTALKPSETEFAFVVQNATAFNWLDASALPLLPVTISPYALFESLLNALKLDRRQPAIGSRLFDVLNQWLSPNMPPADLFTAISELAPALNASVVDMQSIVTALAAAPPNLTLPAQTGSLADMAMLASIASALDMAARYRISGAILFQLAAIPATTDTASAATATLQAQYPQNAWLAGIQPVEDVLRQNRRDALVAYLLTQGPALTVAGATNASPIAIFVAVPQYLQTGTQVSIGGVLGNTAANGTFTITVVSASVFTLDGSTGNGLWTGGGIVTAAIATPSPFLTTDDIFDYYLIDPEMAPCGLTTRLLQPSLAIQQFVQQCFLNLTFSGIDVDTTNSLWGEWSWRQQFRLWQANREVFLYPENYVLPETRTDASPFFSDLLNELRQSSPDADAAETAIENYIRSLVSVARMDVAAHYNETKRDGSTVLHVFASTGGTSPDFYYRTRTTYTPGGGTWSAWQPLNVDVDSPQLVPFVWDERLFLIWPIFSRIAEKQSVQQVATGATIVSASPPAQFWAIQFAMSELSAGQWQPKRAIVGKAYTTYNDDNPLAYAFGASQESSGLGIIIYQNGGGIVVGSLTAPEAQLWVTMYVGRIGQIYPALDLSQEPTGANLIPTGVNGFQELVAPTNYSYSGQVLVYGTNNWTGAAGQGQLNVIAGNNTTGQPVTISLLGAITNPRIVVPQQVNQNFDSVDPFFVADPTRTYLVEQQNYGFGTTSKGVPYTSATYTFQTCYHPYARTFLRELEIGGIPQLMARNLQLCPQNVRGVTPSFDFASIYSPNPSGVYVSQPYPGAVNATDPGETNLDFAAGSAGAYSLYNWEIYYHIPMLMASLLLQNQQYQDAMTWLQYIFNPTDTGQEVISCAQNPAGPIPAPQRFWQMAPFFWNQAGWSSEQIEQILTTGIADTATQTAITNWMRDPFDPHAVASLRISAYAKATVMKFLDNLIAWGDWYYNQYTAEMVSQAEQLYIVADLILGPQPQKVRLSNSNQGGASAATYASLQNIDGFSNTLVNIENVIVAPEPPQAIVEGTATTPTLPLLTGNVNTLLFCIPPNDQLLAYWDTVSQRLDNIRNCRNIQGVVQPLPLYAPPINPLLLVQGQAGGGGISNTTQIAPVYRFAIYLQKAIELTNDVRTYGSLILSALEKQDGETLASLRANQEVDIQTRVLEVKTAQVTEAQDQITALNNQQAVVQTRYDFYSSQGPLNAYETSALGRQTQALTESQTARARQHNAAVLSYLPNVDFGVCGFGGSGKTTLSVSGGIQLAAIYSAWASVARDDGAEYNAQATMAATQGSYQRRQDDWTLQTNLAHAELTQIASQITAATDRMNIANAELSVQQAQISNAQAVSDFLTNKYTNAQLYNWMLSQLTTVYTQAYQLAFSLALQAQNAYQYELGSTDTFIQSGYWDSQHKGLTAGESLAFDLRRMDAQYLAGNSRELELTKHVSLALTSPMALVMLRETGQCAIMLDEVLFDYDYPGQYFRRLRSVALTIPCVTGPYTGVNATLSLTNAIVRIQKPGSPYTPQRAAVNPPSTDPNVRVSPMPAAGPWTIATSSGQNDAGLFDVNLRDERWLPFEGQGAISAWNLVLDPRDNNFDFSTITDVVLHIRYTARGGGDQAAAKNVRAALKPQTPRSILVSVRNTFGNAYYTFFNPPATAANEQTLTLPMTNVIFPFSNLGSGGVKILSITYYVALSVPAAGNSIAAFFDTGGAQTSFMLGLATGQTTAGNAVSALMATASPAVATPQSFNLTVPAASVPSGLATTVSGQTRLDPAKIEDILLIINYSID